tara:strand:+ start:669 stop:1085 length:417 start_codon:yes stop_codon:yes gene_type:complete
MSPSVVLRNYSRVEEALVVWSALQDAGFDATIDNLNHAILQWHVVPLFSGIQVRLPASQIDPAKACLNEMVQTAEQRLTEATGQTPEPIRRSYWRARLMAITFATDWVILALIWFFVRKLYLRRTSIRARQIESTDPV